MESNRKVWIEKLGQWYDGIVVSKNNNGGVLVNYNSHHDDEHITNYDRIKFRNDDGDNVDDLMNLQHLNEPSVLNALYSRYKTNNIYTYTGQILIAVNPFKQLNIYDDNSIKNYNNRVNKNNPHLYDVIGKVYTNIKNKEGNQSVLISGNSGSGKTFSTRYIMRYLSQVSSNFDTNKNSVERKLLESNPILEAFGNAKTLMNDNSSRFGKYIKIYFNEEDKIIGANIETYLLEKVRLIRQKNGERNFHIFYLLLKGMNQDEKKQFYLTNMNDFKIINNSNCFNRNDDVDDKEQYHQLIEAFHIMNFTNNDIKSIFNIVSAILHMGNVRVKDNKIIDEIPLKNVSALLSIPFNELKKSCLEKEININSECFIKKLTDIESHNVIITMMKVIYENMFNWVVRKINENFYNNNYSQFIGLLDIFGFEVFGKNSFEQICINYANESLQQQFNKYVLKNEQKLYEKEKIDWDFIDFPDNQECLNLFENKIHGLLAKIDEQCLFPNGNDNDLYDKIYQYDKSSNYLSISKMERIDRLFTIHHYPGDVTYDINTFVAKNKDLLNNSAVKSLFASDNEIFKSFDKKLLLSLTTISSISITKQFQRQLNNLLLTISKTTPYYIRCLKPNDINNPNNFEKHQVINQLKYSGVLEAIKISRFGFPIRITHEDFNEKYYMLFNKINYDNKHLKFILKNKNFSIDYGKYQVGLTKIFLKKDEYEKIEEIRNDLLNKSAITIQKIFKGWKIKKWYINYRNKVIKTQSFARRWLAKRKVRKMKMILACIKIQAIFRGYLARKETKRQLKLIIFIQRTYRRKLQLKYDYENYKIKCATKIQSIWKMYQIRKSFIKVRNKCIIIQSSIKTYLAKKHLEYLKDVKQKFNRLKNEKNSLQTSLANLQENYLKQQDELNHLRMKMKQQERENFQKNNNIKEIMKNSKKEIEEVSKKNFELKHLLEKFKDNNAKYEEKIEQVKKEKETDDETKVLLAMKINDLLLKHNEAIAELRRVKERERNEPGLVRFIKSFFH